MSRSSEKVREKAKVEEKELPKKVDDKSSKKNAGEGDKDAKPKPRTSNGADYEKKREYQVKITEQKISFKETVRGKQPESRNAKISISSASSPSRTPSPFLKPHERKDYVPPKKADTQSSKVVHKVSKETIKRDVSNDTEDDIQESKSKKKQDNNVVVKKKDSRKSEKTESLGKKKAAEEVDTRKKPAAVDVSDAESVASEKSKKRKKKNRDGSATDESDKKKKRSKLKKHKKSSKKSKKKDRSDKSSESEEEQVVNEDLEKKLREKALVSLMRKNKKDY